jgi:hypothetical protein
LGCKNVGKETSKQLHQLLQRRPLGLAFDVRAMAADGFAFVSFFRSILLASRMLVTGRGEDSLLAVC